MRILGTATEFFFRLSPSIAARTDVHPRSPHTSNPVASHMLTCRHGGMYLDFHPPKSKSLDVRFRLLLDILNQPCPSVQPPTVDIYRTSRPALAQPSDGTRCCSPTRSSQQAQTPSKNRLLLSKPSSIKSHHHPPTRPPTHAGRAGWCGLPLRCAALRLPRFTR